MSNTISVYDNHTGETITREMDTAEQKAYNTMLAEHAAAATKEAAQAVAKTSAQTKLAALGLTADEIAAL